MNDCQRLKQFISEMGLMYLRGVIDFDIQKAFMLWKNFKENHQNDNYIEYLNKLENYMETGEIK